MNKVLILSLCVATFSFSGCDKFKPKKEQAVQAEASEWSCTSQDNLKDLQGFLKQEYVKQIDKNLRSSTYYQADQELLKKINEGLKFDIKNIRTVSPDPKATSQLECEGQIVVNFPKGLLKRAENAYLEHGGECEECEGEGSAYSTLIDYLEAREVPLSIQDDLVKGQFKFDITKTDKEGYTVNAQQQNDVINAVAFITEKAVLYEAYVKENAENRESQERSNIKSAEQTELAQKAMDIRKKELDEDQVKVVERLNQTWERFSDEQKTTLQQDQSDWFEKRDVDCKVLAQKRIYDTSDNDRETYQKHYQYWDDSMNQQNADMQYNKCFNQRTNERIVYLNNVFN